MFSGFIDGTTAAFVAAHRHDDVRELALRYGHRQEGPSAGDGVDLPFALDQIAGWQAARRKLPTWAATGGIVYPPHLNMEQCSSEATARYKAENLSPSPYPAGRGEASPQCSDGCADRDENAEGMPSPLPAGEGLLVDLTGGFGVDFAFMAPRFGHAVYVERDERLCAMAQHNFRALGLRNVEVVNGDAEAFLANWLNLNPQISNLKSRTVIYVDPARRDINGRKVFGIEDCTPNVLALKDVLLARADRVMIKLSPMLDWHAAVRAFGGSCREVHVVSVAGECKELLLVLERGAAQAVRLVCANDGQVFQCSAPGQAALRLAESLEARFLFVPNASIMKAGCFGEVAEAFGVSMLGANSHLFVGNEIIGGFPGRSYKILATTTMNKRELRQKLAGVCRADISVRNFPLSADALRKRLRLGEGGDIHLFATTFQGRHVIIIAVLCPVQP